MFPLRDHEPSHRFPFVTIAIILANVIVFLFEITSPDLDAFLSQYALTPALVDVGDLDTLIPFLSSQFLHAGFIHIGGNMWYLWIFGDNVEGNLGHLRFLLFYLTAGILAALAEFATDPGSAIPMLGASGAVAGALGAYWAFFPHHRVDTLVPFFGYYRMMTLPAGTVLLFWFVIQIFNGTATIASGLMGGGVAWFAHIGGFVFGYAVGKIRTLRHPPLPQQEAPEGNQDFGTR